MESRELLRLKKNITRECLWLYIISILKDLPLHAYLLQGEVERRYSFKPGKITVYKVLYLLKMHGFVSTKQEKHNGRLRKVYSVTPKARKELKEAKKILKKASEKL